MAFQRSLRRFPPCPTGPGTGKHLPGTDLSRFSRSRPRRAVGFCYIRSGADEIFAGIPLVSGPAQFLLRVRQEAGLAGLAAFHRCQVKEHTKMASKHGSRPLNLLEGIKIPLPPRMLGQILLQGHARPAATGHKLATHSAPVPIIFPLRSGDACPECHHTLQRHGRTLSSLYLRKPYLQCSHCKLTLTKRSRH
jgi:hypothetical protein